MHVVDLSLAQIEPLLIPAVLSTNADVEYVAVEPPPLRLHLLYKLLLI